MRAAKLYFRTWGCRHHYQAAENLCDNVAAIFFSKNDKYYDGTKHNELKLFVVKEEVKKQRVSI